MVRDNSDNKKIAYTKKKQITKNKIKVYQPRVSVRGNSDIKKKVKKKFLQKNKINPCENVSVQVVCSCKSFFVQK